MTDNPDLTSHLYGDGEAPAIPGGMKPWAGGYSAPDDWDGGAVRARNGKAVSVPLYWQHRPDPSYSGQWDIIAYTPRPCAVVTAPATAAGGVGVTQLDRDFAAFWVVIAPENARRIRNGEWDHHHGVQAAARHRLAALTPPLAMPGREEVARVIDPSAWGEIGYDDYMRRADEWEAKGRPPIDALTSGYRDKARAMVQPSLTKADRILSLIAAPSQDKVSALREDEARADAWADFRDQHLEDGNDGYVAAAIYERARIAFDEGWAGGAAPAFSHARAALAPKKDARS